LAARATRRLLDHGAGMIVVACNTASTLALPALRERFAVPFVGIVPAVKPAGEKTRARRIAVLATEGTTQAAELRALISRFGNGADVLCLPAPGLADRVEQGDLTGPETLSLLDRYLAPARGQGVDVLVLGCTHYAFLAPAIERMMGAGVAVLEPSDAVARQAARVAARAIEPRPSAKRGRIQYLTSGDPARLRETLDRLRSAGVAVPTGPIAQDEVEL
ncbi:MAG: glutamate racemase, partial [Dehalococcoidia bacterium]